MLLSDGERMGKKPSTCDLVMFFFSFYFDRQYRKERTKLERTTYVFL